jgi:hypothetical protein
MHRNGPKSLRTAVFMMAGSPNYFTAMFIPSTISQAATWDHSLAVYLAQHGIDVWGMDYGWALVPDETTDFSFYKNWGMERDGRDAEIGLSISRLIRGITGQGGGPLHALGFSYGGQIAYTIVGEETQRPRSLRNVKGLVIFDSGMRPPDQIYRDVACAAADADQANIDTGLYSDDTGLFLKPLSDLALTAPGDASTDLPGLTDYQAALYFGTDSELLFGWSWHFVGGYLDENGIPSALRYTPDRLWIDVLGNIPPDFPTKADFDGEVISCGEAPSPLVEHLEEISVPIIQVGAAGGLGEKGYYTATQTSSRDITKVIVQMLPDEMRQQEFGHVDTIMARGVETLARKPLVEWLLSHR